jgi:beta-glucanase (GH16 family)
VETLHTNLDWKLVWSDEFESDTINPENWNFQVVKAGRFNKEWQRYTDSSENAYIENGCLVLKAIHESKKHGLNQYTSARLNTANKFSFTYGKLAARIKLPHGKGIWPAFWMLGSSIDENGGDTPWPFCGEIDIIELYGTTDDALVEGNVHYADKSGKHAMTGPEGYKLETGKFADDFHVFELEWDEEKISWYVDGVQFSSLPIIDKEFAAFHEDFFILLNIAVGGTFAGRPDSSTTFPQFMYIDWIRLYKRSSE